MAELVDLWRKLESRSTILLQTLKDASGENVFKSQSV